LVEASGYNDGNSYDGSGGGWKRVSRKAKELSLFSLLLIKMETVLTAVEVEVNILICYSLLKSGFFTWIMCVKFGF